MEYPRRYIEHCNIKLNTKVTDDLSPLIYMTFITVSLPRMQILNNPWNHTKLSQMFFITIYNCLASKYAVFSYRRMHLNTFWALYR